jgi:hypothetical protein
MDYFSDSKINSPYQQQIFKTSGSFAPHWHTAALGGQTGGMIDTFPLAAMIRGTAADLGLPPTHTRAPTTSGSKRSPKGSGHQRYVRGSRTSQVYARTVWHVPCISKGMGCELDQSQSRQRQNSEPGAFGVQTWELQAQNDISSDDSESVTSNPVPPSPLPNSQSNLTPLSYAQPNFDNVVCEKTSGSPKIADCVHTFRSLYGAPQLGALHGKKGGTWWPGVSLSIPLIYILLMFSV